MNVVVWRWEEITAVELAVAAEVNTQARMPLPAPLLATLTLLLLLVASPRNLPLKTLAVTLPSMDLTPKKQRSMPNGPLSLRRTMSPAVLSTGLRQVATRSSWRTPPTPPEEVHQATLDSPDP